jgi:TonB dependent receptor/TonB-dependent Receptor Plug Domain
MRVWGALLLSIASWITASAAEPSAGQSIAEALRAAESAGIRIIFTDRLVPASLKIEHAPVSTDPVEALREILRPHELMLEEVSPGVYVVKRQPRAPSTTQTLPAAPPQEIEVSASRYEIDLTPARDAFKLEATDLNQQPSVTNDATRAIRRFPGTVGNDESSRTYVRGGLPSENLILLDGVPLQDPFHLQTLPIAYSMIDPILLGRAEFYSGVLPVEYDGYMSSLLSLQLREPGEGFGGRLGLSNINASAFLSGQLPGERNDWLLFARRAYNSPSFVDYKQGTTGLIVYDTLARVRFKRDDDSIWTLGGLGAKDRSFYTHRDSGDNSVDAAEHEYAWLSYEKRWSRISSRTLLSYTALESQREGFQSRIDYGVSGGLRDQRTASSVLLRQDWALALSEATTLRWGFSARHDHAHLDYFRSATLVDGVPSLFQRSSFELVASDISVALNEQQGYAGLSRQLGSRFTVDGGAHWVRTAYSTDQSNSVWNPRLNLLFIVTSATRLRASWGRMSQTFAATDLPVERNRVQFDAQPSSTLEVLALEHDLSPRTALRAELYNKQVSRPQPRLENLFAPQAFLPELRADAYVVAPESSNIRGFDLHVSTGIADHVSGWLSYSYSQAKDEIDGQKIARAWDQPHSLAMGLAFESPAWLLSGELAAHSNWPLTPLIDSQNALTQPGAHNSQRDGYYLTLDVKAARSFRLNNSALQVSTSVTNVTNRRNTCCDEAQFFRGISGTSEWQERRFWSRMRAYISVSWDF